MMIQPTAAQRNQIATMSCTLRAIWRRFSAGIKTPQAMEELTSKSRRLHRFCNSNCDNRFLV
jgi:hypothetical protein